MHDTATSIEVRQLSKRFHSFTAIDDLSFSIKQGQVVGFLGPNGAGKSTTMRILCGILPATAGFVSICGIPVASQPQAAKRHIGYMPENNPLPDHMRVEEYLRFRARLKEIPSNKIAERVENVMEICDLQHKGRRKIIGSLSKGYCQRVGIAEALLADPEIIIMDEPTIGLDPHQVLAFRELIQNLGKHRTLVISSHILAEVEHYCDRVIIINQGHIIADGTPEALSQEFIQHESFHLEVAGEPDTVRRILNTIDDSISVNTISPPDAQGFFNVRLSTSAASGTQTGEHILTLLNREKDIRVRTFYPHRFDLENIFLAATRRDWREKQATDIKPLATDSDRSETSIK